MLRMVHIRAIRINSNPQDIADPLAFIGQTGVLETGVSTPVDFFA